MNRFEVDGFAGVRECVSELQIARLEPFAENSSDVTVDGRGRRHIECRQPSDLHARVTERRCLRGRFDFESGQASHVGACLSRSEISLRMASTGWPRNEA